MKIFINAYACCPNMGSEPGMAWNWCVNLAQYCELHIVTEGEFRDRIEKVAGEIPQGKNMHFYYNPVSDSVRKMCWNQGDWRFYWYYRKWQKRSADMAREICKKESIDVLHQLNMIGFRECGYLWKVSQETGIPFVWGPIDAKDCFPMAYAQSASLSMRLFLQLKNVITQWQLKHNKRVYKAAHQASYILAASSNSQQSLQKYLKVNSILINETGTYPSHQIKGFARGKENERFNLLWVGKMDFRKQLGLAINSLAETHNNNVYLHVVGGGDKSDYVQQAKALNVNERCFFHGNVTHERVQEYMHEADVLFFTSVAEGTPHVVLEAIGNGLPVLCFDTCGHGDSVNNKVGIKVPLTTPLQSTKDFAEMIEYLYHHREVLREMSKNCAARAEELSWDNKAKQVVALYQKTVEKRV